MVQICQIVVMFVIPTRLMTEYQIVQVYGAVLLLRMNVICVEVMGVVTVEMEAPAVNVAALMGKCGTALVNVVGLQF